MGNLNQNGHFLKNTLAQKNKGEGNTGVVMKKRE